MLDRIVVSRDRKSALMIFDTHVVGIHSDVDVMELINELVIKPAQNIIRNEQERERRFAASLEKTVEIDLSRYKDVA